mgnify:CR=1 FL=1
MRKVLYILADLSDSDVDWLAQVGTHRQVVDGEAIIRQGEPATHLFIVIDGRLAVQAADGSTVAILEQGEVVGELSFLDSRPPTATVVARGPALVLAIDRQVLSRKLASDHSFAAGFYRALGVFLASRLRQTMASMAAPKGRMLDDDVEDPDEIDPALLDSMALAGKRFEMLLNRFRSAG